MRIDMSIDWTNITAVRRLARQLGPGMVIVKHADRPNYNITHASRRDLLDKPGVKIVSHR